MNHSIPTVPVPANEPVLGYVPGSDERADLDDELSDLAGQQIEIPLIIGGQEVRTGNLGECRSPHDHSHVLATYHKAGAEQVEQAANAAAEAWKTWSEMPWKARATVCLKAAELLATSHRMALNASTMLGQSKTAHQAEIDAACELIDFLNFNPSYLEGIYSEQPESSDGMWNAVEYRALEGFVFAVTPFNFTSIAANLCTAPALMGNTVLWKPASSSVYSGWFLCKLFEAAGFPPGVINFLPGSGGEVGRPALARPDLAGIHFTGSTPVFQGMWKTVGENIANYRTYPRIVGETGGKDFVVVHPSADTEAVVANLLRGAFEYQGQKCSAASRAYIPQSLWPVVRDGLAEETRQIVVGDVRESGTFMGAVIDEAAFDSI